MVEPLPRPEPALDSDRVAQLGVGDPRQTHQVEERVEAPAEPEGEPSRDIRCNVVAIVAVTSACRVLWFVAAVAIPSVVDAAAAAPDRTAASLKLNRSERNTEPSPICSASRTSSISCAGIGRVTGKTVEAQFRET